MCRQRERVRQLLRVLLSLLARALASARWQLSGCRWRSQVQSRAEKSRAACVALCCLPTALGVVAATAVIEAVLSCHASARPLPLNPFAALPSDILSAIAMSASRAARSNAREQAQRVKEQEKAAAAAAAAAEDSSDDDEGEDEQGASDDEEESASSATAAASGSKKRDDDAQVERILSSKLRKKRRLYLVQWRGAAEPVWEQAS